MSPEHVDLSPPAESQTLRSFNLLLLSNARVRAKVGSMDPVDMPTSIVGLKFVKVVVA